MGGEHKTYTLVVDLMTRNLRDVELGQKITLPEVDVSELANSKCKVCLGRGRTGYNIVKQHTEPCICVRKDLVTKLVDLRLKYKLVNNVDDSMAAKVVAQAEEYRKITEEAKPRPKPKTFWARLSDVFRHIWWKLTAGRDKNVIAVVNEWEGKTRIKTVKKEDNLLKEGSVKKGGLRGRPTTPRPDVVPGPQNPKEELLSEK